MTVLERTVNGQPGLIAQQDGVTVTVHAFEVAGDRIDQARLGRAQLREAPPVDDGLVIRRTPGLNGWFTAALHAWAQPM